MVTKKEIAEYFEWAMGTEGAFEKADGDKWLMKSESSDEKYVTSVSPKTVFCTCPGFKLAPVRECRHVQLIKLFAVAASSAYEQTIVLKTDPEPKCPDCESKNCKPYILRGTTRKGYVQRYSCEDCGRYFSENPEYVDPRNHGADLFCIMLARTKRPRMRVDPRTCRKCTYPVGAVHLHGRPKLSRST